TDRRARTRSRRPAPTPAPPPRWRAVRRRARRRRRRRRRDGGTTGARRPRQSLPVLLASWLALPWASGGREARAPKVTTRVGRGRGSLNRAVERASRRRGQADLRARFAGAAERRAAVFFDAAFAGRFAGAFARARDFAAGASSA